MINFAQTDARLIQSLKAIVVPLLEKTTLRPDQIMVVGAACRDIMHSALGYAFQPRGTNDFDLGIAVADWSATEQIETNFPRTGNTGIRYLIEELPVDIMPFGEVEDPTGISHPKPRGEELNVFGFADAYQSSLPLEIAPGLEIRIPTVPGYAMLKLNAWFDRSQNYEDKDAKDLALVAYWYANSAAIEDRLWDIEGDFAVLESAELDVRLAAAQLLGRDIAEVLSPENQEELAARWPMTSTSFLADKFILPTGAPSAPSPDHRLEMVSYLGRGLQERASQS